MADDSLDGLVRLFEVVDVDQNEDAEGKNEKTLRHLKKEVMLALDSNKPVHSLAKQIWKVEDIINHIRAQVPPSFEQGLDVSDPSLIEVKYKFNDRILSEVRSMLQEFYRSENYVIKVPSRSKKNQKFEETLEQRKLVTYYFPRKMSSEPNNAYLRECLRLFASEKGFVVGDISYTCGDGERTNCASNSYGREIPSRITSVDLKISSNDSLKPNFILLVEKHSVFVRLAQDLFWNTYNCIIITGSGMPDVATRYLLRKLAMEFQIGVYGLFDCNPYGVKILCTYRYGSMTKSYDSGNLTTPNIIWLGLKPGDLATFEIPDNGMHRVPMNKRDLKVCRSLIDSEVLKNNEPWKQELRAMINMGTKTEIEALYTFGCEFLADVFVPYQLQNFEYFV